MDIINGKCVRLTQGDYNSVTVYHPTPLDVAKSFEDAGLTHLHLVDLDGAKEGKIINWKVIETISNNTKLSIDFGGGLKTDNDLRIAFDCGATKVTGGSIAIKDEETFTGWIKKYPGKIILGADAKEGKVAINGWTQTTEITVKALLQKYSAFGIKEAICTDISRDGKLQGVNINWYKELKTEFKTINFIASGGISGIDDLTLCADSKIYGVIVGKAIYEKKISLKQLQHFTNAY